MKTPILFSLLLLLVSPLTWAGLIELKGSGITQHNGANPPVVFSTSFILDADVNDSDISPVRGIFLNAIKSGFVMLNSGHEFSLDSSSSSVGHVETAALFGGGSYAYGTIRMDLIFKDIFDNVLSLSYFSHTTPAFEDAGFVGAGTTLKGLEYDVWFEGEGWLCMNSCSSASIMSTTLHAVPVIVSVAEPQPFFLFTIGLLIVALRRWKLFFQVK